MIKKETISIYLPSGLVKQLKEESEKDKKTVSAIIQFLLQRHFERRQYKSLLEYLQQRRNIVEIGMHEDLNFNETITLKNDLIMKDFIVCLETTSGIFYEEIPD